MHCTARYFALQGVRYGNHKIVLLFFRQLNCGNVSIPKDMGNHWRNVKRFLDKILMQKSCYLWERLVHRASDSLCTDVRQEVLGPIMYLMSQIYHRPETAMRVTQMRDQNLLTRLVRMVRPRASEQNCLRHCRALVTILNHGSRCQQPQCFATYSNKFKVFTYVDCSS